MKGKPDDHLSQITYEVLMLQDVARFCVFLDGAFTNNFPTVKLSSCDGISKKEDYKDGTNE